MPDEIGQTYLTVSPSCTVTRCALRSTSSVSVIGAAAARGELVGEHYRGLERGRAFAHRRLDGRVLGLGRNGGHSGGLSLFWSSARAAVCAITTSTAAIPSTTLFHIDDPSDPNATNMIRRNYRDDTACRIA